MGKRRMIAYLLLLSLLLTGCGGEKKPEEAPSPTPQAAESTAKPAAEGPVEEKARVILEKYEEELAKVALQSPWNLTFTIPRDMIRQMALDAQETGAQPENGQYRFYWRQGGNYAYEATSEEALRQEGLFTDAPGATPDPADETPMDSQLMGDYAVAGGGLFDRVRAYEAAEDLSFGRAEISDTLDGRQTGHEAFSFSVKGDSLYFVDAVMELTATDKSGVSIRSGYLAAVGVLRPDGLDIIEYHIDDLTQLPDPGALDVNSLAASVEIVSRLTAQGDQVTLFPRQQ